MKTKAYKLAAELGLQEHSLLEWLRENGYPNARRADTIRSDVVQAARKALGRGARTHRSGGRTSRATVPSRPPPQSRKSRQNTRQSGGRSSGGGGGGGGGDGFKVSFAELLESHLPSDANAGRQALPDTRITQATRPVTANRTPTGGRAPVPDPNDDLRIRVARAESERDRAQQDVDVERARAEGYARDIRRLERELQAVREDTTALDALRADTERLELERARLKQQLAEAHDERATLEQTCTELQTELQDTRAALEEAKQGDIDHGTVLGDLETARQREIAWRTRALELERAVAQGGDIIKLLKGQGLEAFRQQVRVLRTLLGDESTALPVLRAIRQVDAPALEKLIDERLRPTCAHPLCNRVTRAADQIPLRVDDDSDCAVCAGDAEQRWFHHMVQECSQSGIRRLLVIGGDDAIQTRLRALSQGQPVDLRLVSADEEALPARAAGRVEGCDALILWSSWVVPARISDPYAQAALAADRPIVSVLGVNCGVVPLARATVNRVARTHVLRAV